MQQHVTDEGDAKRYFTQLPNIVFEIGLKPLELVLYAHLKRAAGTNGKCFKSTATLARETGMGAGSVSRTKTALEARRSILGNKPLIRTREVSNPKGGKPFQEITITDIWKANTDRFTSSTVEVEALQPSSPMEIQVSESSSSVEVAAPNQVPKEAKPSSKPSSTVEIKKNSKKNNEENKKGAEARAYPGVALFRDITGHNPTRETYGLIARHLGECSNETLARECWQEWLERGYNTRSLKWLTEWFPNGGPTGRNIVPQNGNTPKVEYDPFGEPWIPKPFTAEDAIIRCPDKNPDDIRAHFEDRLEWKDVRCR